MTALTEEMVFARTKTNNLGVITKLNCWGSQLSDVSILRKMTDVTVLSLSVNNIETLEVFQYCTKLQELFVRKNKIKDLNEVCYLRDLVHLKNLWLGDNPCADDDGYRLAVIRALPRLEKLDGISVEEAEYEKAQRLGRNLTLDPSDERFYSSDPEEENSEQESPEEENHRYEEEPANHTINSQFNQYYREREEDRERQKVENGHHENNHHQDVDNDHRIQTSQHSLYDERPETVAQRTAHYAAIPRSRTQPNVQADPDIAYSPVDWKRRNCPPGSTCCIQPHLKRPNERRTNVLNAVLCLVKELDFPNLEVVQMAVKCRMEELAEEINPRIENSVSTQKDEISSSLFMMMPSGQKFQDMIGPGYVMYRRVYNKNDVLVRAMLSAGLEEYITNGFTMEEISDRRRDSRQLPSSSSTVTAKQIRVPHFASGASRRSSQLEKILEELYQMERDISTGKPLHADRT
ncbi:hypothetical protein GE061_016124 [Apolygus lucorum]|uniref:U2A'/phosphoprotein 32 family A C-terminal domain-containing protein n=1 Tax=Apolygus lucorum TaxID=248454 RepID=A0A6A4IIM6_APOLU|nr:hypothetical protein GE061_016124 [Apolygus lucorum]